MNHDFDADLDYTFDWATWLTTNPGDSIDSATLTATPDDVATVGDPDVTDTAVTFRLSEATANVAVTCHIVTAQAREDDRTMRFAVKDR